MDWLKRLNPQQKRIAAALGAGLMLGLVVILSRRSSTTGAQDAGAAGTQINPLTDPGSEYSFADNGAAVGELTSSVSALAGRMDLAMQGLTGAQQATNDALKELPGQVGGAISTNNQSLAAEIGSLFAAIPSMIAPPPSAAPGQVAGAGVPQVRNAPAVATGPRPSAAQAALAAKAGANVSFQDSGSRAGLNFKNVSKNGNLYAYYESKPGKGDFGEGGKVFKRKL